MPTIAQSLVKNTPSQLGLAAAETANTTSPGTQFGPSTDPQNPPYGRFLMSPLPLNSTYQPDALRQFYRGGVPQYRLAPSQPNTTGQSIALSTNGQANSNQNAQNIQQASGVTVQSDPNGNVSVAANIQAGTGVSLAKAATGTGLIINTTPGIVNQIVTTKTLASNVVVSASTLTVIDSINITMPPSGGPWRAFVSVAYFHEGGTTTISYVTDGTNNWSLWEQVTASNVAMIAGAMYSPVTYANGANVTFSVNTQGNGAFTVEAVDSILGSTTFDDAGCDSVEQLKIWIF